jgi:WD40 repeat protein
VVRPWQHKELETALPCSLFSHGDLVVSLWIPAGYRTVATPAAGGGGMEYTLTPTAVPFRYVLVWDLSENSTRTYGIPNTVSCISPDCRFVAYCHVADRRTKLAILDAQSGDELWAVGGEGNLKSLAEVGDLAKVTELAFSGDGRFLLIGDVEGNTSIYDVREAIRRRATQF